MYVNGYAVTHKIEKARLEDRAFSQERVNAVLLGGCTMGHGRSLTDERSGRLELLATINAEFDCLCGHRCIAGGGETFDLFHVHGLTPSFCGWAIFLRLKTRMRNKTPIVK